MSEEGLAARLHAGRAAWPALALDDETFLQYLRDRSQDGSLPALENAADLFLACACVVGVNGAAAAFERMFRSVLERAIAQVDRSAVDEATQVVLVSLLVTTPDARPRLATYGGRSSLRAWLATVATRATIKLRRRIDDKGHESLEGLALAFVAEEPELALAKAHHGPELAASFRTALAKLDSRELVLLRLHHAEGWSVDRLGALYRVGRSTAARWVAAARDHLVEGAKRDLRERLTLTTSELESLVALLQSNMQLSLIRLLGTDESPDEERGGT
jgi:RNA polymerase sigma-70 factor (ECF subfamily)